MTEYLTTQTHNELKLTSHMMWLMLPDWLTVAVAAACCLSHAHVLVAHVVTITVAIVVMHHFGGRIAQSCSHSRIFVQGTHR